jgi:uncharacterized protein (DUF433 family)
VRGARSGAVGNEELTAEGTEGTAGSGRERPSSGVRCLFDGVKDRVLFRMSAIRIDPDVLHGRPCFTGTRVPVDLLFVYLRDGYTVDVFLDQFPTVKRDHVDAVLRMASDLVPRYGVKASA